MRTIVETIKAFAFGVPARGERVVIPDLKNRNIELDKRLSDNCVTEDFNLWCSAMNFGKMHTKKQS